MNLQCLLSGAAASRRGPEATPSVSLSSLGGRPCPRRRSETTPIHPRPPNRLPQRREKRRAEARKASSEIATASPCALGPARATTGTPSLPAVGARAITRPQRERRGGRSAGRRGPPHSSRPARGGAWRKGVAGHENGRARKRVRSRARDFRAQGSAPREAQTTPEGREDHGRRAALLRGRTRLSLSCVGDKSASGEGESAPEFDTDLPDSSASCAFCRGPALTSRVEQRMSLGLPSVTGRAVGKARERGCQAEARRPVATRRRPCDSAGRFRRKRRSRGGRTTRATQSCTIKDDPPMAIVECLAWEQGAKRGSYNASVRELGLKRRVQDVQ